VEGEGCEAVRELVDRIARRLYELEQRVERLSRAYTGLDEIVSGISHDLEILKSRVDRIEEECGGR